MIFGFYSPDIFRNLSLFPPFYSPGNINFPIFKPRYVLDGEELRLVNSPTIPLEQVPDAVKNFADMPIAQYEVYFNKDDYIDHWWLKSRLVALALEVLRPSSDSKDPRYVLASYNNIDSESAQLAFAIMRDMKADVEAHGGQFVIVHLPSPRDMEDVSANRPLSYAPLLQYLDENYEVIHTLQGFDGTRSGDYIRHVHYSAEGSQVIAEELIRQLSDKVTLPEIKIPTHLQELSAQLSDQFVLLGYTASQDGHPVDLDEVTSGLLTLTLYWQTNVPPNANYTIFVHVHDADGKFMIGEDIQPLHGIYPTDFWNTGEVVATTHNIELVAGSGPLTFYTGMYTWPSIERLPAFQNQQRSETDRIQLWPLPED